MAINYITNLKKISLREAVMYFGYSSDHIAYLIRKGKIAGEKIYKKEYWKVSRKGLLEYIKGRQKASSSRNFFEFLASNKYFFKKYLSLKEASEVSGYASDYIGYLVRQGKVSGRKFYCGSSWLTTRDAVKEYLDSKPGRKDEKFFNFSFHFSGGKKYFSLKISKASLAISMVVVFFGGLVALASSSQDQNQIVKIFPSQVQTGKSIDGRGWQNEDRIKGSPDVGPEGDINYFSDQNSAVYKGGPDALLLSGFNSTQLDLDSDEINDEIFKDIEKKEGQGPAGEPSQDLDSQPVQSGEQEVSDPQADASGSEPSEQENAEEGGGVQSEPSQGEVEGSENIQEKTEGEGNFSQNGEASGGLPGSNDPLPDPNGAIGGQSEGLAGSDGADQSSGGQDGQTAAPAESEIQGSSQPEAQTDASAGQVSFLDRLKGIFGRSTVKAEELLNFKDVSQKQLVSAKINISLAGGIKDPDIVPAGQDDPVQGFWGRIKNTFSSIFKNFPQIAKAQTSEAVEPPAREQEADIRAGQTNELSIEVPLIGEEEASSSNQEEQQNEDSADIPDQDAGQAVEEGQDQLQGGPAAESGQAEPEEGQIKTRDAIFGGEKDINSQEPVMEGVENDPQPVSEEIISNPDDKLIIWYGVNGGSGSIEWSKLGSISQESFSNASNGGYLSFDASFLSSWDDIEGLQIKIEGAVGGQMENPIYVDSFWVEAEYQELGETVKDFELKILKDGWKADEEPSFELVRKTPETSAAEKFFTGIGFALGITKQEEPEPEIKADLSVPDKNSGRGKMEELASGDILKNIVREKGREKREIKIAKKSFSGPGKYSFSLSVEDKGIVYEFTQDFTWGVLAINTNKSVYVPGEEAFLQMGVLNEKGSTVCNAGLEVEITSPGGIKTILTTERTVSEEIPEDSISSSSQERSAEEQGNFGENGGAVEEEGSIDGDASVSSSEAVLPEGSIVPSDKGSQVVQEEPEEGAAPEDPQTSQEEEQANQPEMDIPQEGQSGAETTIEAADDGGSSLQRIKDIFGFSYAKAEENDLAGPADPIINNGAVTRNSSCGPNNVTSLPDYSAYYKVEEIGSYHIKLTASTNNGLYSIEDSITVQDSVPFDVERIGPTRIYPMSAYEMTLKIKANEDFNGSISEPLPEGFEVVSASGQYSEQKKEGERSIVWDADIKQGEIYELKYRFDAPDISPYLYLLGPMKMGGLESEITLEPDRIVFQELRQWQLASDATTTFQYILGGTPDNPTRDTTEYNSLMGPGLLVWGTTESNVEQVIPTAGTLSDFQFKITTAPGSANSWVFTIRKNNAATALSVIIAESDTLSSVDTDTVTVAAGDKVSISAYSSTTPTNCTASYWVAKFTPDTPGETILMSHGGTLSTSLYYVSMAGHKVFEGTRIDAQALFPASGTLKKFYTELSVAPGAGTARTFKIEKGGVDSSIVNTISGTATTANDVSNTLSVAAGNLVTIQQTAITGAPAASEGKFGIVFVPDTSGQWIVIGTSDDTLLNTGTEYRQLTCGDNTNTATESETYNLVRSTTAKSLYVQLSADPGTSPSGYTFTLRRNGTTDTSLALTVTADNTTGNYSTDVAISDEDLLSFSIVPVNSPSAVPKLLTGVLFYNAPTGGASNITVSGTVYSDEGSNGIGAGKTVRVKVNGAGSFSTTTNASSSYSISDVAVASAGDVLTVYLDEGTEKAAAITRITSTAANVTDMDLYQNRIIARHHDSGPLTIADLDEYDSAGDSDIQFTASSTAGTLTISSSTQELFVWASSTLTLTGSTTAGSISLGSLDVNGTLNASSTQTITISGSADITGGTFNTASSTVNFTTDYDTSIPAITYYNLQLSGSSVFYDDFETGDFSKWSEGAGTTSGSIFQATTSLKYAGAYGVAAKSGGVDGYAMAQNEGLGQYQTMIQDFYQYLPSDWNWGTASGISIANFSDSSWNDRFSIGIEEMEGGSTDTSFTYNYWNSSEAQQWDDTGVNFTKGQWQHIKAEIFVATSTGYVKIWLDGSLIVNNTGINTGSTNIDNVMVGTDWTDGATPFFYQDNCVYDNNAAPTYTLAAAAGQTLTINNNLTVGSGLNLLNVTGATYNPTIDVNGSVSIIANSAFIAPTSSPFTVGGSWTNTGTFTHSTSTVTFDATSESKTISTGGSPFYTLTFNGSGGGWTLNDAATTTNTLNVTAGTLTWGDGNGDNLVTGATTTIANGAVMQSKQDLAQGSTMTWTSTGNIALSGTLDLGKNTTLNFNSGSSVQYGLTSETTGYFELQGTRDDYGTSTSNTSETTIEDTAKSWTIDSHNGKVVRMTSGLAFGKVYDITDTTATTLVRVDNSSINTTVDSQSGTTILTVCSATTTLITADDEGIGRYLHDQTGTTGWFKIVDSISDDADNCGGNDMIKIIASPTASFAGLADGNTISISDGVQSGDGYEILDYAVLTANSTNHGYIYGKAGSQTLIRYADVSEMGGSASTEKNGLSFDGVNGANSGEGVTIEHSRIHDGYMGIRFDSSDNNNSTYSKGISDNAVYNSAASGIFLDASDNNAASYNNVYASTDYNFAIAAANRNTVNYNISYNNPDGFLVTGNSNIFTGNSAYQNTETGFWVVGYNNLLKSNDLFGNWYYGILLDTDADNNVLSGNSAYANDAPNIYVYLGSDNNILDSNNSYGSAGYGFYVNESNNNVFTSNNSYANDLYGFYTKFSKGTVIAGDSYGAGEINGTADIRFYDTATSSQVRCYNCTLASTEMSNVATSTAYFASFGHDGVATSTKIWGEYSIPVDDAETPNDESANKFNYADNTWEDSFTPHGYYGTGAEDTDLDLAFNGGTMGGSTSTAAYMAICNSATTTWTVYRDGSSIGTATTSQAFTDSDNNVQFTIGSASYVAGDAYTFAAFKGSASTNTQKHLTMMQDGDKFTVPATTTLQLQGQGALANRTQITRGATGGYSFDVAGTINAQYYDFNYLGGTLGNNGLNLQTGATVTSLDYGSFDNFASTTIASSSFMTINTSLISTGAPSKTLTGLSFANTGSNANYNVKATSTAVAGYWNFADSTGAFSGENYDYDASSTPGEIRWTISGITISGYVFTDEGNTTSTAASVINLAVDGVWTASTTASAVTGAYSFTGVFQPSTSTVITVYTSNASEYGNTVTRYSGAGNLTGLKIFKDHVIVRHEDDGPITIADLDKYDQSNSAYMLYTASSTPATLTVTSSKDFFVNGGDTFSTGGAGGDISFANVDIDGTFNATSTQTISVSGNWYNWAIFNPASSTVQFTSISTGQEINTDGDPFYNLTFNGAGGEWTFLDAATTTNDMNAATGTVNSVYDMTVLGGDVTGAGALYWTGASTFLVDGTGNFGGSSYSHFYNLTFGDGSGEATTTASGSDYILVTGALTIAANQTLNGGGATWDLSGQGTPFAINGIFNSQTSTFYYSSAWDTNIASTNYYDLKLQPYLAFFDDFETGNLTAWDGAFTSAGSILQATSTQAYAGTYSLGFKVGGADGRANTEKDYLGQAKTSITDFYTYIPSDFSWGTGSGTNLLGLTDSSWNDRLALMIEDWGNIRLTYTYWDSTAASHWNDGGINLTKGQWQHFRVENFVDASSGYVKVWVDGSLVIDSSGINTGSTNIDNIYGGSTWADGDHSIIYQDNIYFYNVPTYTLGTAGSQTITVANDLTIGNGTDGVKVTGATQNPTLDVNGDVSIGLSSVLTAPTSSSFTVAGNWTDAGTFTHSSSTVIFDTSATSTFSGATTFYNLTSNTASKTLQFTTTTAASTTVAGTLTLDGQACETQIKLRSTNPGSQWYLNAMATTSVDYVDVQDSNATGSAAAITATNSTDSENNINWSISEGVCASGITISGTVFAGEGSTTSTAGSVINLAVDGVWAASTTASTTNGSYIFIGVTQPATSTVITVYSSNASEYGNTVTRYLGNGNVTGIDLYKDHVVVRHEDNGPITIADLDKYDQSNSAYMLYTASSTPATLTASSTVSFYVMTGKTFQTGGASGAVSIVDLENYGTFTATSTQTISVSDSWYNLGTFNSASSTVQFISNATGSEVLSGGSPFYILTFNGSGGGWTLQDSATTTNALNVTAGTLTWGDGNGDNLVTGATTTIASGAIMQSKQDLAQADIMTWTCNGNIALSGSLDLSKNTTLNFNSASSVQYGLTSESTGYFELQGTQDDTGTSTSNTSETAIEDTSKDWTADSHNNKNVRMTSGLAFGKIYDITDTASTTLIRADNSSINTTVTSTTGTVILTVCSATTTMITASDEGIGRYLHDQTGTTGWFQIVDSINNDATNCGGKDMVKIIAEPTASFAGLANGDTIAISDGVQSGDGYEILDYATLTAEATNHGYVYAKSGSETVIRYADVSEMGADVNYKYGLSFYNVDGWDSDEGVTIEKSRVRNGYYGIRLYTSDYNNSDYNSGIFNNAIYSNSQCGLDIENCRVNNISYNNVYNNGSIGIYLYNDGSYGVNYRDIVSSNNVYANAKEGFWVTGLKGSVFDSNNVFGNISAGFYAGGNNILYSHNNAFGNGTSTTFGYKTGGFGSGLVTLTNCLFDSNKSYANNSGGFVITGSSNIFNSNIAYGNTYNGFSHSNGINNKFVSNKAYQNSGYGLYHNGTAGLTTIINDDFGSDGANSSGDIYIENYTAKPITCYNCIFASPTTTNEITYASSSFLSFKHNGVAISTKLWGEYAIPADTAETPNDESAIKFNYANNTWEDSFIPHGYYGSGAEDTNLSFAFNGGSMGGSSSTASYLMRYSSSGWTVYRDGTSIGTATTTETFTDSANNVQFTIGTASYAAGDAYTFVAFKNSANTNTQKFVEVMQADDKITVGSGTTLEVKGGGTGANQDSQLLHTVAGTWDLDMTGTANIQEATINDIDFVNGTTTVINSILNNETVTSTGVLNVDWYLGTHLVDKDATGHNIDTNGEAITVSEADSNAVIYQHNGTSWSGPVSSTTTDSGADGKNPQPNSSLAIRIREYQQTSAGAVYYKYNLAVAAGAGFSAYDYYNSYGNNYITSASSTATTSVDKCISGSWQRNAVNTMNTPYSTVNEPPANGSWYAGMSSDLQFSIDSASVNLGVLSDGNNWTATGTTILYATTSYAGGYSVTAYASEDGRLRLGETGNYIERWSYANSTPALWDVNCEDNAAYCGFGYTTNDTTLGGTGGANRFAASTKYAGFATSSPGELVADSAEAVSGTSTNITYKVSAKSSYVGGEYDTTVYYLCTVNY